MSMDGRYIAKSHGWRCGYVQNVRYAAVPWMVRSGACPWMDGISLGAMDGGVAYNLVSVIPDKNIRE